MKTRCNALTIVLAAAALSTTAVATDESASTVHFNPRADSLITLPVMLNGAGPFDFLLDTGTTETVVESALAGELKLPITRGLVAAMFGESSGLLTAHADKLEVSGASVRDLDLLVAPRGGILSQFPGVRGILGENFLRNFDLLLDNGQRLLQLQQGPGVMEETLTGQHVPLHTRGDRSGAIGNRLILAVNAPQLQAETLSLQLDSGARALVLFNSAHRRAPGINVSIATVTAGSPAFRHMRTALSVDNLSLGEVLVLNSPQTTVMDVDGLLPTALFRRIYISHYGGFAIFNPVTRLPKVTH